MPSRSIIQTGVGPHREPRNRFPAMAAAINLLAARAARVQSRRNLSRSLSPKLDHSHSITRFDRSRTGPNVRSSIPATRQDGVPDLRAGGDLAAYALDWTERTILFCDTLRQRADNMIAHERAGKPPLLDFDFEVLLDARRFPEPANYALLRITRAGEACLDDCFDPTKPPVIVVDPRAGHGPGIGGFKRESEVGMALHEGHAVYFVVFYPEPVPSQELTNVLHALRRFVEEVAQRHDGRPPVLYGNCQAGWAMILLAADCEGLAGPVVLNGSPLSYWAGEPGVNPMRVT